MKAKHFLLLSLLISMCLICYSKDKRPIHNGYYNAKQLQRRGYNVHFKGTMFVNYKRYLEINKL